MEYHIRKHHLTVQVATAVYHDTPNTTWKIYSCYDCLLFWLDLGWLWARKWISLNNTTPPPSLPSAINTYKFKIIHKICKYMKLPLFQIWIVNHGKSLRIYIIIAQHHHLRGSSENTRKQFTMNSIRFKKDTANVEFPFACQ